jgi:hypothetical protein
MIMQVSREFFEKVMTALKRIANKASNKDKAQVTRLVSRVSNPKGFDIREITVLDLLLLIRYDLAFCKEIQEAYDTLQQGGSV